MSPPSLAGILAPFDGLGKGKSIIIPVMPVVQKELKLH